MGGNDKSLDETKQLIEDVRAIKDMLERIRSWRTDVDSDLSDVKLSTKKVSEEVQRLTLAVVGDSSLGMNGLVQTLSDLNETIKDFKKESPTLVRHTDLEEVNQSLNGKLGKAIDRVRVLETFKIQMIAYWVCGTTISGIFGYLLGVAKAAVVAKAVNPVP